MYYNSSTKEVTQSTLTDLTLSNLSVNNYTGSSAYINSVTTNKINFGSNGSIYFQTGSSTGCFISPLRYNVTGAEHYVYYNNTTKELSQASPTYFFSYSTGTQTFASNSVFQPVTFNVNNILYHTFQHTQGSSVFTGTFAAPVTLQFTYSLQLHARSSTDNIAAAVLYLDSVPIAGSYRSCSLTDDGGEYILTNTVIVNIPTGSHAIQLQAAARRAGRIDIGGGPTIGAPGNSYTSANLFCTRII
jgi:hypothetical protein